MPAVARFAASDTGQLLAAAGIDLSAHIADPVVAVNLRVAQMVMANRAEPEPSFEEKYG